MEFYIQNCFSGWNMFNFERHPPLYVIDSLIDIVIFIPWPYTSYWFLPVMWLCRWYVYWRAEWAGRISCRDVVWANSCTLHSYQQRTGCNGTCSAQSVCIAFLVEFYLWGGVFGQLEKYKNYDFGRCPRVYCCGQPCLPVGQSDIHRSSTVKIYCPKCEDIYYPRSKYQGSILTILLNILPLQIILFIVFISCHKSTNK